MADEEETNKRRQVEGQVNSRQELPTGVLKGFLGGIVLASLSKNLLLGFIVGGVAGAYLQQSYSGLPDLKETWRDVRGRWEQSRKSNR